MVYSVYTADNVLRTEVLAQESLTYLAGVSCFKSSLACKDYHTAVFDNANACRFRQLKSYTKDKTLSIPSAAALQVNEISEAYFRKYESDLFIKKDSIPALWDKVMTSLFTAFHNAMNYPEGLCSCFCE